MDFTIVCPACMGTKWKLLPGWPHQSMLSDGRSVPAPLEKKHCGVCGLIQHSSPPSQATIEAIFSSDYALHTRLVDNAFEKQRQTLYADWILNLLDTSTIDSIFEIGAGTGLLMAELRRRAPHLRLRGVEPVVSAVSEAAADLDIEVGLLRDINAALLKVDVVLSVNVIEHVHDPVEFLMQSRAALSEGGRIVVICPDGDHPSTEILIYDHIHSFTLRSFEKIVQRAGLTIMDRQLAPVALGAFQAVVLVPGSNDSAASLMIDDLYERRSSFLRRWQQLDQVLLERVGDCSSLWAFGSGENAQLLRAYAPKVWSKVQGIVADSAGVFDGKPIEPYQAARRGGKRTILLAVRPGIQGVVEGRLSADGHTVIRWDDLV
ncbi:class I SAM-dependent methyltransferase [Agrobacterium fabrum]|uniref:class I SAM-dependent methyltransferase n=1 Tax=Agrobacterium fabrum TaxID=1176649 RepID=UPI0021D34E9E|nr:class I SAM-dependent methyltransferase [Agrobacterium fabrum]